MTDQAIAAASPDDRQGAPQRLLLAAAGALVGSVGPINFASGALAANMLLGDDKSLATLPLTSFVVGTAVRHGAGRAPDAADRPAASFHLRHGPGGLRRPCRGGRDRVGSFVLFCAGASWRAPARPFSSSFALPPPTRRARRSARAPSRSSLSAASSRR